MRISLTSPSFISIKTRPKYPCKFPNIHVDIIFFPKGTVIFPDTLTVPDERNPAWLITRIQGVFFLVGRLQPGNGINRKNIKSYAALSHRRCGVFLRVDKKVLGPGPKHKGCLLDTEIVKI